MSDSDNRIYKVYFRNILRLMIVLVMVAAFLYQMWELFGQFLSGLTTVAITFEEKEEFELPSFAFCDSRAFIRSVSLEETLANYSSTTFDLDQEVELNGMVKTVGSEEKYFEVNHTTEIVPTIYNGNCKLYEFQQSHPVKTYIGMYIVCTFHYIHNCILFASEFVLPLNRTYDVFLLEKGSKLSLVTQEFLTRPQPSFTLDHSTQLFISFTITKISNENCQKITASQQMKCIVEKLGKAIQKEVSCLPPQVYTILNEVDFEMPLCKNDTDSARKAILV